MVEKLLHRELALPVGTELQIQQAHISLGKKPPPERDKVLNKFRKEKVQVILLQETHLLKKGHEKYKKVGYGNSFSFSFGERHIRGVMALSSNSVKFELLEEIGDKEGKYLMISMTQTYLI
uniref:Endonuclease/exonuclease/phosphatase domain-containing protein n=1 Tax=Poecilia mexicana TaxID=48701 RepID=A0A3B3X4J2_9TELE